MQQSPVAALPLEVHAGYVQRAVAGVADREGAVSATACAHAAETRRAGDRKLASGRVAGDCDIRWARGIVAGDFDRPRLGAKARGPEADRQGQSVTRSDRYRIGQHTRHKEIPGGGRYAGHGERAAAAVVEDERLIGERPHASGRERPVIGDHRDEARRWRKSGHGQCVWRQQVIAEDGQRGAGRARRGRLETDYDVH